MIPIPSGVRVWIATGHTDMRRGMQGLALQVQESSETRSSCGRPLYFPRSPRRSRQDPLARWNWAIALRQTIGPRKVHMAIGVRRRGVDLGGADGVHARGDRLAKSTTDVAAQERRLACVRIPTGPATYSNRNPAAVFYNCACGLVGKASSPIFALNQCDRALSTNPKD